MVNQLFYRSLCIYFEGQTFAEKVLTIGTQVFYDLLVNNNIFISDKLVQNLEKLIIGILFEILNQVDKATKVSIGALQKRGKRGCFPYLMGSDTKSTLIKGASVSHFKAKANRPKCTPMQLIRSQSHRIAPGHDWIRKPLEKYLNTKSEIF